MRYSNGRFSFHTFLSPWCNFEQVMDPITGLILQVHHYFEFTLDVMCQLSCRAVTYQEMFLPPNTAVTVVHCAQTSRERTARSSHVLIASILTIK